MLIIDKLKLGGLTFKVIPIDPGLYGNDAEWSACSLMELKIWVNESCTKEQQVTGILHEVIELVNDMNDLGLTHIQISVLENFLYQAYKDNFLEKDK